MTCEPAVNMHGARRLSYSLGKDQMRHEMGSLGGGLLVSLLHLPTSAGIRPSGCTPQPGHTAHSLAKPNPDLRATGDGLWPRPPFWSLGKGERGEPPSMDRPLAKTAAATDPTA